MLQAMGLGGWMFDGIDMYTVLQGLGFREDTDERWALPNPTGLEGVFEAFCPPHYPDMRAATEALARRSVLRRRVMVLRTSSAIQRGRRSRRIC